MYRWDSTMDRRKNGFLGRGDSQPLTPDITSYKKQNKPVKMVIKPWHSRPWDGIVVIRTNETLANARTRPGYAGGDAVARKTNGIFRGLGDTPSPLPSPSPLPWPTPPVALAHLPLTPLPCTRTPRPCPGPFFFLNITHGENWKSFYSYFRAVPDGWSTSRPVWHYICRYASMRWYDNMFFSCFCHGATKYDI